MMPEHSSSWRLFVTEPECVGLYGGLMLSCFGRLNLAKGTAMSLQKIDPSKSGRESVPTADQYRTRGDRRAEGKALRETVPREEHGGWKPPKGRRDPVELVLESNEGRMPDLVPIRHGRMLQSPFAFYRGTAALMAADLAHTPNSGLRVQACGDAHLMNFGGFATPERNVIFDINDLDETLPAPWEWDLKRLTASVVVAGRHLGLRENDSVRAAGATVQAYREQMADYAFMKALDVWYDRIDLESLIDRLKKEAGERRDARARRRENRKGAHEKRRRARFPQAGRAPRRQPFNQGQPAPDIPSQRGTSPRVPDSIHRSESRFTASPCPSTSACCSTAFIFSTWRSRWSGWAASARSASRAVHGRGRRPAFPADQGSAGVGA